MRSAAILLAVPLVALTLMLLADGARAPQANAQDLDAQALAVERELLCPQCTNERLDVCELAICRDMKRVIRERLEAGDSPDSIIRFFSDRYGQRVLADLPRSGFNLVLFGWVGGSVVLMALAAAVVLTWMRRSASPAPSAALDDAGERWLDEQLAARGDDG